MAYLVLYLDHDVSNGEVVTFRSPADCSKLDRLVVTGPESNSATTFMLTDAHGNSVAGVSLFAGDTLVNAILDTEKNRAMVQNADTNAYLEARLGKVKQLDGSFLQGAFLATQTPNVVTQRLFIDYLSKLSPDCKRVFSTSFGEWEKFLTVYDLSGNKIKHLCDAQITDCIHSDVPAMIFADNDTAVVFGRSMDTGDNTFETEYCVVTIQEADYAQNGIIPVVRTSGVVTSDYPLEDRNQWWTPYHSDNYLMTTMRFDSYEDEVMYVDKTDGYQLKYQSIGKVAGGTVKNGDSSSYYITVQYGDTVYLGINKLLSTGVTPCKQTICYITLGTKESATIIDSCSGGEEDNIPDITVTIDPKGGILYVGKIANLISSTVVEYTHLRYNANTKELVSKIGGLPSEDVCRKIWFNDRLLNDAMNTEYDPIIGQSLNTVVDSRYVLMSIEVVKDGLSFTTGLCYYDVCKIPGSSLRLIHSGNSRRFPEWIGRIDAIRFGGVLS